MFNNDNMMTSAEGVQIEAYVFFRNITPMLHGNN
jgi:hypothetical protein